VFERFETIVRCNKGHLFTTIWVPLGSLKAIRLGPVRYQRCPVGHHWATVRRVDPEQLDAGEREAADAVHDAHVF
jgi:hypothetical protein